ncbi:hypothetical protein L210DRAFT_3520191 [Boletus edulis BED1]|uniref:Bromo domain-containing protein n=1 Tax=Boletus edulis BED1 TaxID=1328754 RepID=A0AAD4GKN9_BOLED|nr:hypothetical protein L210DRAFT_3520191 [Boletus edulis BED1]
MAASDVPDSEDASLSTIECLILSQAVYEHGADAWHPSQSSSRKTPLLCASHSPTRLDRRRGGQVQVSHPRPSSRIVAEINEIRSGAWDDKIRTNLVGNSDANPSDVADSQSPQEPISEPPQESATVDLSSTDQGTLKDTTEREDGNSHQQHLEVPPDVPVDVQILRTTPVAEDVVREPTPADIIEIASEEPTIVEASEESKLAPETAQMDVEEPVVLQEPDIANEKPQQREGKRKIPDSDNLEESQREKKRPREESTSTDVDEQTPRKPSTANSELASHHQTPPSIPNKRFQTVIGMLHSQISQHRNGNIFHNPIKNSEAPDYHDIIKRPMDLKTIKARVKDGIISNSLEFQRDVYLMFANAMMYNRPTSDIYHMAAEMMAESEMHINTFRQTEGFIRSTRS